MCFPRAESSAVKKHISTSDHHVAERWSKSWKPLSDAERLERRMGDPSSSVEVTGGEAEVDAEGIRETVLPSVLVERLSLVAETFGQSENQFIKTALREQIDEVLASERIKRRIESDFYSGDLSYENLVLLVGREDARAYQYLKERLHREPNDISGESVNEDVYGDFDAATAPTPDDPVAED